MRNKNIKTILLSLGIILIVALSILIVFFPSKTTSPIPEKYIGNWINESNNNWEYGFFEDFAVYNCDFWEYQSVNVSDEKSVYITLTNKNEKISLQLIPLTENQIKIKTDDGDEKTFILMGKLYPNYTIEETKQFSTPTFSKDSVTIIGYYRNLNIGMKGFVERFFPSPFKVSISDFVTGKDIELYADIDNLGRFKITFPVMNTQELFVDWKRTRITAVVEPNNVIFLFADIADYIPTTDDKRSYETYIDRPKQVLFMGDNARLNNEIRQYNDSWTSIERSKLKNLSDMEYLHACEKTYNKNRKNLQEYIEKNPTVSEKFRIYKHKKEKYNLAFNLLQHRFDLHDRTDRRFQKEYVQYVEDNFSLDDESDYTFTRDFSCFLRDCIGYLKDTNGNQTVFVLFEEIAERLQDEGKLTAEIKQQVAEINELVRKSEESTEEKEAIIEEIKIKADNLNANDLIKETAGILHSEKYFLDTSIADSLIANLNLRELWIANRYNYWFEVLRKPLSMQQENIFKQKVKNPYLIDYIGNIQKHYLDITNEGITYEASLKNTKHLNEYKEADELFEELIKPYKGKVVYVDFWGTWCSPCRRDMKVANNLKEKLQGEDIVFMYFANRSPEDTWKNFIKEIDLTGENIVHYRLPDKQQGMIERKFAVNSFPTYMLINKDGKVVNTNAESPTNIDGAILQIKELLK